MSKNHIIDYDPAKPLEPKPHDGRNIYNTPVRMKSGNGTVMQSDMLNYMRQTKYGREVHSDGFLSLSHIQSPPAYECPSCGFQGIFKADKCIRCETPIHQHLKGN